MGLTFAATTLRNDGYIGLSRLLQAIFVLVVVALIGSAIPSWQDNDIGCTQPPSMNYLIACGVLTLLYLVYLAISTCSSRAKPLWNPYVQLTLDGLFLIFWIAACAVATPTCAQFESACSSYMSWCPKRITWNNLEIYPDEFGHCTCDADYTPSLKKLKRAWFKSSSSSSTSSEMAAGVKFVDKLAESQGVGAALVLLFAFTLGFGLYRFFQDKRAAKVGSTNGQSEPLAADTEYKGPQATSREVPP